ncbi:MAG: hypothetical protein LBD96_11170 [Treponema sp.]|nr:hypothetical protein [Treponema sp.]
MKRLLKVPVLLLVMAGLGSCDFILGPDEPAGGVGGNLVISFEVIDSRGAGRAITSGADLPKDVLDALRYELILTGPDGEVLGATVKADEPYKLTAAVGQWRVDVEAYQESVLGGRGSVVFMVTPGTNSVQVPMRMNGTCYEVSIPAIANGRVQANFTGAFPGTPIAVTVTADSGYVLTAMTLTDIDGTGTTISGPPYTFMMPASDVRVSAEFNPVLCLITIEGPQDEVVAVTAVHSAGHTPPTEISRSAGESVSFTLDSSDYTTEAGTLKWLVQGDQMAGSGNSLTINANDYVEAIFNVTVMIKVDSQWYSTETSFKVVE